MKRILVTGGSGQVGRELARIAWPPDIDIKFPPRSHLDLTFPDIVADQITSNRWDCVVNCAAYTAVDAAESDVSAAFLVNSQGPAWLAEACAKGGIPIIHLSTDYVFGGTLDRPYREDDPVGPINVYGASKLAGEFAVRSANHHSVILRTAWVISAHGSNFAESMLRLGRDRSRKLTIVEDQIGCPTNARDIASALRTIALRIIDVRGDVPFGVYHFASSGQASWFDLATEIFEVAKRYGMVAPTIQATCSSEYPSVARRPANSTLDTTKIGQTFGVRIPQWREAVEMVVGELMTNPEQGQKP